jgi:type IV pilus assembly protein PilW
MRRSMKLKLRKQTGLTMVEMMVAMTISLFMLIALAVVYSASKAGFAYTNNTARLSEDAAFAIDMLGRDIRMAGYAGCAGSNFVTDASNNTTYTPKFDAIANQAINTEAHKPNPFQGVIAGDFNNVFTAKNAVWGFAANNAPAMGVLGGGSTSYTVSTTYPILYLAGGSGQGLQVTAPVDTVTSDVPIPEDTYNWGNNSSNATYFIISDCKGSEIFRASASSIISGVGIVHDAIDNATASLSNTYTDDAVVSPLVTSVYFLATPTGRSVSSLYRRWFNGSVALPTEELVQNVEAMTFQYGVNTSNTTGGEPTYIADFYQSDPTAVTDWSRVVSIRIGLVLTSEEDNTSAVSGQSVPWLGGTFAPSANDRRLRRAYSTTVSIRNRMGLS